MQCIFINNGVVTNVAEFDSEDHVLAQKVCEEHAWSDYIFGEDDVNIDDLWDGKSFNPSPERVAIGKAAEAASKAALAEIEKKQAILLALADATGFTADEIKSALNA